MMQNGEFEPGEFLHNVSVHQAIMAAWSDGDVIYEIPEHVSKRGHNLSIYSRDATLKQLVDDGLPSDAQIRDIYLEEVTWVQANILDPLEMS